MQCIILAGGLGTRVRSLTGDLPKSLLPIHGKPFIHYQLDWLKKCGIQNVILSIGYQGQLLRSLIKEGSPWGLHIRYVDEGNTPLGTGGALRLAFDEGVLDPTFLMMYGDSFLPIDFRSIWVYFNSRNEKALMTVIHNQGKWDKSNVCFDGQKVTLYDKKQTGSRKMDYIDYGLSVLRRDALAQALPQGKPSDLSDYFHDVSLMGDLAGIEIPPQKRFYEIGSIQGVEDFTREEPWATPL